MIRCSILKHPRISVHIRGMHKWSTNLCMPLSCVVHHLVYTAQPWGAHKADSCLALHKMGVGHWARENVTPERYGQNWQLQLSWHDFSLPGGYSCHRSLNGGPFLKLCGPHCTCVSTGILPNQMTYWWVLAGNWDIICHHLTCLSFHHIYKGLGGNTEISRS